MTPLDKPLRRELMLGDQAYTLTIDPTGLKLVEKGRRNGVEIRWADLVTGDAELVLRDAGADDPLDSGVQTRFADRRVVGAAADHECGVDVAVGLGRW